MSNPANVSYRRGVLSAVSGKMRLYIRNHPEWWVCFLFITAWVFLARNSFSGTAGQQDSAHFIYCIAAPVPNAGEQQAAPIQNALAGQSILKGILSTIPESMPAWLLMVVAMMFPLLSEPVKHVAFSVRQKDKNPGMLTFLAGYTIAWATAGIFIMAIQFYINRLMTGQSYLIRSLVLPSGFMLAALYCWLPVRPVLMARCKLTMPISIKGWQLYTGSLLYGIKMGLICFTICWAPMLALAMTHHSFILMYAVTIVLFYERYLLPHTSKAAGYAWAAMALALPVIDWLS